MIILRKKTNVVVLLLSDETAGGVDSHLQCECEGKKGDTVMGWMACAHDGGTQDWSGRRARIRVSLFEMENAVKG